MLDRELDQFRLPLDVELALQVQPMRLDRAHRQAVALRDLLARQSLRERVEDVPLARREPIERRRFGARMNHPGGDSLTEERLPGEHRADRAHDLGCGRILQQIAARARAHRLRHVFDVVVHRQHQHANRRKALVKDARERDSVHALHADVHQREIGRERLGERERFIRIARFADHGEAGRRFEAHLQAVAHERMIVDEQEARGAGRGRGRSHRGVPGESVPRSGTRAATTVWPICELISSVPPSASSRSRMLRRPMPPRASA
ncbi:hypothetical protein DP49_5848 [Burkholderia pseudomallei]|nr:hypothetical protein DP49_5848 [Burkholderia pseudomallei]